VNLVVTSAVLLALAWALARLAARAGLPPLLGMLAAGVAVGSLWPTDLLPATLPLGSWRLEDVAPEVRQAVLAVILLRAGLSLSRAGLRQAGPLALRLGLLPLLGDATLLAAGSVWLLDLPLGHALVLAFTVAAISPAIVIPGTLELLARRRGRDRRLPAALLAGAPLDNIACLLVLGVVLDQAGGGQPGVAAQLGDLALNLCLSLGAGLSIGWLASAVMTRATGDKVLAVQLWVAAGALIALGRWLEFSYVLAIITLGLTVRDRAPERAEEANRGLLAVWNVVQYALFGLIGAAVDLEPLAQVGLLALGVIALGQLGRAAGSLLATSRAGLSGRERVGGALCYVPKATIQAAFGSMALDAGLSSGQVVLSVAVLGIVVCAPLGVVALHRVADQLLPSDAAET